MKLTARAKELRQRMTQAEVRLWNALRQNHLGVAFRRQVPLGPYIPDG